MRHNNKPYFKIEQRSYKIRQDYLKRWGIIANKLNIEIKDLEQFLVNLYVCQLLSCNDISKLIQEQTGENITKRTIERIMKGNNVSRTSKEAFILKAKKGEINWKYKENKLKQKSLTPKKRYEIMKRDNFRCVLCGNTSEKCPLEIDHIIAKCNGGTNDDNNLRTLCSDCNIGKRINEKEL